MSGFYATTKTINKRVAELCAINYKFLMFCSVMHERRNAMMKKKEIKLVIVC
jgi:hypothetical protein